MQNKFGILHQISINQLAKVLIQDACWTHPIEIGRPECVNLHGSGVGRDIMWSVGDAQARACGGVSALEYWSWRHQ